MKKVVLIYIVMLLFSACAEKVIEPPENLIPKDEMTNILYDLAILNATKNSYPRILKKNNLSKPIDLLFENYNIDSLQFVESDLYYASMPLEYQSMYEEILARIEKYTDSVEKIDKEKAEKARKELNGKKSDTLKTAEKKVKNSPAEK